MKMIEKNKIYNMDCVEGMKQIEDNRLGQTRLDTLEVD
jgi:DNA modification methylase